MAKFSTIIKFSCFFIIIFLSSFTSPSYAQENCSTHKFSNNKNYVACNPLPAMGSFLHWNYHPSNNTIDIAYRQPGITTSNWVVWSLNPSGGGMLGAQCLVALPDESTGLIRAYTSPISASPTGYGTMLEEGPLSFGVPSIEAEFIDSHEMIIYAIIQLPSNGTSFTHLWQFGEVSENIPQPHRMSGQHMSSIGRIDFATGKVVDVGPTVIGGGGSRARNKNIHGILNVVSWGIMMPAGVIMARYLKVFKISNPAWFYMHVICQASGYIVGVSGWATGMTLHNPSGLQHSTHRNLGITIFALGTLQVLAMRLRPKPDHKYRFCWNIYHHLTGYTVIALSIVNIFKGFDILDPEERWKNAYIGILIFLGACVTVLEPYTWYLVLKRKREGTEADKHPQVINENVV